MPPSVPSIRVPLPGGSLTATPDELRTLAAHIRRELRRQVVLPASAPSYQVWLPTGRRLVGSAAVLDRLADRIERAAVSVSVERARVAGAGVPFVAPPSSPAPPLPPLFAEPERVTQLLPDLSTNTAAEPTDPTDPYAAPDAGWYQYWGCIWAPDWTTAPGRLHALRRRFWSPPRRLMDGWFAATPEVEVWDATILLAGTRLAVSEPVELAADEVLVLRWARATLPTLFLDPARVALAQWLAAHPGAGLPPEPHRGYFRLNRSKQPTK